jgi:hypothetical protein
MVICCRKSLKQKLTVKSSLFTSMRRPRRVPLSTVPPLLILCREREKHRATGLTLLKAGNKAGADKCFQKAVDITPAMANKLFVRARAMPGVECIVAPYVASAKQHSI